MLGDHLVVKGSVTGCPNGGISHAHDDRSASLRSACFRFRSSSRGCSSGACRSRRGHALAVPCPREPSIARRHGQFERPRTAGHRPHAAGSSGRYGAAYRPRSWEVLRGPRSQPTRLLKCVGQPEAKVIDRHPGQTAPRKPSGEAQASPPIRRNQAACWIAERRHGPRSSRRKVHSSVDSLGRTGSPPTMRPLFRSIITSRRLNRIATVA